MQETTAPPVAQRRLSQEQVDCRGTETADWASDDQTCAVDLTKPLYQ